MPGSSRQSIALLKHMYYIQLWFPLAWTSFCVAGLFNVLFRGDVGGGNKGTAFQHDAFDHAQQDARENALCPPEC